MYSADNFAFIGTAEQRRLGHIHSSQGPHQPRHHKLAAVRTSLVATAAALPHA